MPLNKCIFVGFETVTVASMKMAVLRVVAPYSLTRVNPRFRGICCGLLVETAGTSEMLANFCHATPQYNREDCHFHVYSWPKQRLTGSA